MLYFSQLIMELLVGVLTAIVLLSVITFIDRKIKVEGTIIWKICTILIALVFILIIVFVGRTLIEIRLPQLSNSELFRKDNIKSTITIIASLVVGLLLLLTVVTTTFISYFVPSLHFKKVINTINAIVLAVLFIGNIITVPDIANANQNVSFLVALLIGIETGLGVKTLVLSFWSDKPIISYARAM